MFLLLTFLAFNYIISAVNHLGYVLALAGKTAESDRQGHDMNYFKLRRKMIGDRLVVGHQVLVLRTGVRVPVPEPKKRP